MGIVLVAFGFRWLLIGPGGRDPYVITFPAVIVSGLVFNRGCAFFAVFLSALLAALSVTPRGGFFVPDRADAVALILFLGAGLFIAVLIEDLHAAVRELTQANRRLAWAEAQQDALRREAAHRRRNDVQRLIATLRLQAQASQDERARGALHEAMARIQAFARIDLRFEAEGPVNAHDLFTGLVADLRQGRAAELRPIAFAVAAEAHELSREQAVSLGLIATELIVNALKYAFPKERAGTLSIGFRRGGENFVLTVADDGVGFDPAAAAKGTGLGRKLVRALAAQLGGQVEIRSGDAQGGTVCIVRFPARPPANDTTA
jgi:two-component sensor histidine kinase